jgi:hypothetical protein
MTTRSPRSKAVLRAPLDTHNQRHESKSNHHLDFGPLAALVMPDRASFPTNFKEGPTPPPNPATTMTDYH